MDKYTRIKGPMYAYKVFSDEALKEYDFQYEIGVKHRLLDINGVDTLLPIPCVRGFHACFKLIDCFEYKRFHLSMRAFKVRLSGIIYKEGNKYVSNEIKLVRELPMYEVDKIVNDGLYNLGYGNKGNWNKGDWNKGNSNKGDSNKGNSNKGNSNKGNSNNGNSNNGNSNNGNWNAGDSNKGNWNAGNWNAGNGNKGDGNKTS